MSRFEKAAIVGATGPTGFHLASFLRDRVPALRVVSRSESNLARMFPDANVERIAADATDASATLRALDGCDLVYACIGLPGDLIPLHPVIARNIANALRSTGARCVQVSSYWAYLPIVKLPLDEDHPRAGGPEWVRYRRDAEDILQEAGACVLHLPDFYGPRVHTSTLQNALKELAAGKTMNWIGSAETEHEFIYVPDAMKIAAEIAIHDGVFGQRFVLPGSGPLTGAELAEMTGGKLRAATPWLLRIVSLFDKELRGFMQMVPHYARPIRYDASKLRSLIGEPAMTPYEEGIRDTLESLRS